jgi:hypothetical protein
VVRQLRDEAVPIQARAKRRIPFYYWPWWMLLLAVGLFVFYVVLTPVWMGIRLVAWLVEGRGSTLPRHGAT